MKVIYKYKIGREVLLPREAEILNVDFDRNYTLSLWAIVDTDKEMEKRYFEVCPTGVIIPGAGSGTEKIYVGSAKDVAGIRYHVFEVREC